MVPHGDVEFLRAAIPDLQRYVISDDLYWPLRLTAATPGSIQTPQLTIGNLLLSLRRLRSQQVDGVGALAEQIEQIRREWRSNWAKKADHEHASRLNLWQQYMRELREDSRQQASYYASEVRHRTILELLHGELLDDLPGHENEQLAMLDNILRGLTRQGDFVWEQEVQSAFPPAEFWFLWVALR
jgi:hypothetical protein